MYSRDVICLVLSGRGLFFFIQPLCDDMTGTAGTFIPRGSFWFLCFFIRFYCHLFDIVEAVVVFNREGEQNKCKILPIVDRPVIYHQATL
ncbi:hypothetical protein GGI43DRAFT_107477 [Trichoderma evansii]